MKNLMQKLNKLPLIASSNGGKGKMPPMKPDSEYERCVLCGCLTSVKKDTPIVMRSEYVVGAGQLCWNCNQKLKAEAMHSESK